MNRFLFKLLIITAPLLILVAVALLAEVFNR